MIMNNSFKRLIYNQLRNFSIKNKLNSSYNGLDRKTLNDIKNYYKQNKPISMITSYDYLTSKLVEKADIDIGLIGDSLAMTTLGYESTNELTFEEFLYHVKSAERGNKRSFLTADLPFGTFEISIEKAIENCIKLIKFGKIQSVKIEGCNEHNLKIIKNLINIGIPVMGHIGLTPQKHNLIGGFNLQGNKLNEAIKIYNDCLKLEKAGCFAIVLECIPNKLANIITEKLSIPTIGIGAGPNCSGQVLVISDILGMSNPNENNLNLKFVKNYNNFFEQGVNSLLNFKNDIENKNFPNYDDHGFKIKKDVLKEFQEKLKNSENDF